MDFKKQERYYNLGNNYWWLAGKYNLITSLLRSTPYTLSKNPAILDMGCGPGNMLDHLSKLGNVSGMDMSKDALIYCGKRGYRRLFMGSGENIPLKSNQFDLVVALDVIEHIDDDEATLNELYRIIKPGGYICLSVPAYMFLWGDHDEIYGHKRRYTAKKLKRLTSGAGFNVEKLSYFEAPFVLPLFLLRKIKKYLFNAKGTDDFIALPNWLNKVLKSVLILEGRLIKYLNIHFGVTIICIAKK